MTYASAGLIQATDYNALGWTNPSVGGQMGVGTGDAGMGQSTAGYATIVATNAVTAAQWSGLITGINNGLQHQGAAAITPASVTAGNLITYYSTIATGSAQVYNNRGTTGLALTAGTTNNSSYASAWGNTGSRTLVFTQTVTFASGDMARYFFNAGGNIALSYARSGGSATTRNTDWTALCTACGTIKLGWKNTTKTGGSGTTNILLNTNNGGYWAGTASYVVHFKQFDASAGYTTDYIQTEYFWSGTAANGGSPVLNLKTTWANSHVQSFQDTVDGTATTSLVINSPATTYLTSSWGTPVFASVSVAPV
jgi:hypothetical protein